MKRFVVYAFHPNFALGGARDLFRDNGIPLSRDTFEEVTTAISAAIRLGKKTNADPEKNLEDYVFQIYDTVRNDVVGESLGRDVFAALHSEALSDV